jgi:hypothetical protein
MLVAKKASLPTNVCGVFACRPCVKDHNSIVLRAENVGTKYEWISRMMRAVAASAGPPPPPTVQPQPQPAAADPRRASKGGYMFSTLLPCCRLDVLGGCEGPGFDIVVIEHWSSQLVTYLCMIQTHTCRCNCRRPVTSVHICACGLQAAGMHMQSMHGHHPP